MGCVCPKGYARYPSCIRSACIPLAECPKCPPNEVYGCRRLNGCEPTCEQPGPYFICRTVGCGVSCTCAEGLVRNQENNKYSPELGGTATNRLISPRRSDSYITRLDPSGDAKISPGPNPRFFRFPESITLGTRRNFRRDRYQPSPSEKKRFIYHMAGDSWLTGDSYITS
ncbi:hypothetical protein Ddc_17066 [Ditylenchus destructor]|nr:hypothetical protein Ddc_17066 [Ditylenchus destructor]